jgi:DNA polymerase III subunit alpha
MAATLSRNLSDITEITKLMDECKAMGINVLGPDVNESVPTFGVNSKGDIRFGMAAVKGVGENAVLSIVEERKNNGPYKGIFDFVQRVNLTSCNRKNIESLALAGAFDSFPEIRREQFMEPCGKNETFADVLVRYGNKYQLDKNEITNSLFSDIESQVEMATPIIPEAPEWSKLERLNKEKELVGIYISAHPLDEYRIILDNVCNTTMKELEDKNQLLNRDIIAAGVVVSLREARTKNGKLCGFVKIEDYSGTNELAFFGMDWLNWRNMMVAGNFLYIKGKCLPYKFDPNKVDFSISSIELLQDIKDKAIESLTISVSLSSIDMELVSNLDSLTQKPGNVTLKFNIRDLSSGNMVDLLSGNRKIAVTTDLVNFLKDAEGLKYSFNQ